MLILVAILCDQLTVGINSAFQAANFVKQSAIYVGFIKLLIIPLGLFFLYFGYSVYAVVIGYALVELFAGIVRLKLANKYFDLTARHYYNVVLKKIIMPIVCCATICLFPNRLVQLLMSLSLSSLVFVIIAYRFSLNEAERLILRNLVNKLLKRK